MSHLFLPPIELAKVISGPVGYEAQLSAGCRRLISRVERFGLVVAVVYGELSAPQRGSGVEQRRGPLKELGSNIGGRVFFVRSDIDSESVIEYLERTPVLVQRR